MRTIEEAVAELRKDIHSDVYLGKKTISTYLDEILEIHNAEKTRWIPCSERLPEIHQDVILSLRSLDVEVGFRSRSGTCFYCRGNYIEPQNVLAWKPLPEPYHINRRRKNE